MSTIKVGVKAELIVNSHDEALIQAYQILFKPKQVNTCLGFF